MVHQPSGGFQGEASDIEIHASEILTLRGRTARKGAGGATVARSREFDAACVRYSSSHLNLKFVA